MSRPGKRDAVSIVVDKLPHPAPPGAIEVKRVWWQEENKGEVAGISHGCPCGCGMKCWIDFSAHGFAEHWGPQPAKDADMSKLTVTPSLGIRPKDAGGQYHWHGYLRDGVFEEC